MNENRSSEEINISNIDFQKGYPRLAEYELRKSISNYYGVNIDDVFILNGIDEAIWFFLKYIKESNRRLYIDLPNYYGLLENIKILGISIIKNYHETNYDEISTIRIIKDYSNEIDAVYLCSPLNPIGRSINNIETIIKECYNNQIMVFLDQAYIEFASSNFNVLCIDKYENLIIARTFSKAYGLAGIRCGYVITKNKAFKKILDEFKKTQPYHTPSYSLYCAKVALRDQKRLNSSIEQIKKEKNDFYKFLKKLGLRYIKTETNFVLIYTGKFTESFKQYLRSRGVIVTLTEPFGISGYVRITIGNKDDMILTKLLINDFWRRYIKDGI